MPKNKTHETFVKEVYDLVGDEYKVVSEYVGSLTKIEILHTKCGHKYYVQPNNFLHGIRCPFCFKSSKKKTHEEFLKEVYDLVGDEYKVIGNYIVNNKKIKFLHTKCNNEFFMTPSNFLTGCRCPVCNIHPSQIVIGFNDMWTTNPELAKLLLNPKDGYKYTQNSNEKVDWKCQECDQIIKKKQICKINTRGLSCPRCGDSISYPNRLMYSVLNNLHIDFKPEKSFEWCRYVFDKKVKKGIYDFYFKLNNQEYVIEMDGEFHFKDNTINGQTKNESNLIDTEKDKLAILHNILPIRINCEKSELEYIKTEILKSNLKDIFDLSIIDWQECERQSISSLKMQVCKLWDKYHSTKIVSEIMKYSQTTIIRWLKSCSEVGLCDYESMNKRKIFCEEYKEFFDSMTEAGSKYNIDMKGISSCCLGINKTSGGLHWRYATPEEIQLHKER